MFLMSFPVGTASDYLRITDRLSTGTIRKLFNSMGTIGPGLCMIGLGFVGCNSTLTIGILVVSMSLSAGCYVGFNASSTTLSTKVVSTYWAFLSDEPCRSKSQLFGISDVHHKHSSKCSWIRGSTYNWNFNERQCEGFSLWLKLSTLNPHFRS